MYINVITNLSMQAANPTCKPSLPIQLGTAPASNSIPRPAPSGKQLSHPTLHPNPPGPTTHLTQSPGPQAPCLPLHPSNRSTPPLQQSAAPLPFSQRVERSKESWLSVQRRGLVFNACRCVYIYSPIPLHL